MDEQIKKLKERILYFFNNGFLGFNKQGKWVVRFSYDNKVIGIWLVTKYPQNYFAIHTIHVKYSNFTTKLLKVDDTTLNTIIDTAQNCKDIENVKKRIIDEVCLRIKNSTKSININKLDIYSSSLE